MTKSKPPGKQVNRRQEKKTLKVSGSASYLVWGILAGILLLTLMVYWPALANGFIWDDLVYIQKNPLIYTIDLPTIFSSYLAGNYHPLTVLIHALEYHFFGFEESGYHIVNVLIHIINTALVFYFIRNISQNLWIGLITSLFFGIHPMHVESVAWISELKDLLYTCFFLASLIAYLHFTDRPNLKWYLLALSFFLLSLLSKGMAVSLPVVLLLIDFFKGRRLGAKVWLEKIPFLILSIVFGIIAVFAQHAEEAIHADVIPLLQRIIFAFYGYLTYIQKLILPVPLSAYYPYPVGVRDTIPVLYYAYVLLSLLLVWLTWFSLKQTKKVLLGLGFFTITIFLVLKLLPVGYTVMADRYSYVPSIGIFYFAGEGLYWLYTKQVSRLTKSLAVLVLIGFTSFFGYTTFQRCHVWENGFTLWSDTIEKYDNVSLAFLNRGVYLLDTKKYVEAEADLNRALELNPNYGHAYFNRGMVYQKTQRLEAAMKDYTKAIELEPSLVNAYVNRGNLRRDHYAYDLAMEDYNKAIELDPSIIEAYNNKGILYQNQARYQEALMEFTKAIQLSPTYVNAIINRGNMKSKLGLMEEAVQDYNQAISINPKLGVAYYARGILEIKQSRKKEACDDFQTAVSLGYAGAAEAIKQHCQ